MVTMKTTGVSVSFLITAASPLRLQAKRDWRWSDEHVAD
jgi:hypothetical protein